MKLVQLLHEMLRVKPVKSPNTRRERAAFVPRAVILNGKIEVGSISNEDWRGQGKYIVRLKVQNDSTQDNTPGFKWVTLTAKFENLEQASQWVIRNSNTIAEKFKLVGE